MAQSGSQRSTSQGAGAPPEPGGAGAAARPASGAPVVVKKYANRRLYNTEASSYVTLEDLARMVRQGRDFVVYDAKTGEDITRSVLTQIIVEEESKGQNLLPTAFLRQLIAFYGDSLQSLVPRYLEFAMAGFARQQEQMRRAMEQTMGGFGLPFATPSLSNLEEMGKQNMAMLERAMSLFSPFRPGAAEPSRSPGAGGGEGDDVESLRAEVESLRRQLAELRAAQGRAGPKGSP
ncbi:polyhydroxyalkanoate synthesis repressor PhaR [Caldovatus sediminis]|jgi:polyhydroxyalkanoate synthesis repressor PhaR|uniref:Polyhydroxyalkanoate synthesis repressor PhaR n=1 Tax=Caldovatus sediminis TaxID=2041189 RepID=A0A8J2Z846_9PROT|nr:polyhydroxyalkanoate synthesis repressor PhaR [Caldovatus sediminis]GGG19984.1 polyhydroxyalkanoate synthesis repressor PhaR [Caldovatus sediminis]